MTAREGEVLSDAIIQPKNFPVGSFPPLSPFLNDRTVLYASVCIPQRLHISMSTNFSSPSLFPYSNSLVVESGLQWTTLLFPLPSLQFRGLENLLLGLGGQQVARSASPSPYCPSVPTLSLMLTHLWVSIQLTCFFAASLGQF